VSTDRIPPAADEAAFAAFDVADFEVLDVADGLALPEMGASSGNISTSSSSSCTCSAC
jgi:thiazolylpeptide-type bacteriocin precursor